MSESHALRRTSPKGGPFIGTCYKCGTDNLPSEAVWWPCSNPANLSPDEALMMAISPEKPLSDGELYHRLQRANASEWAKVFLQFNPACNVAEDVLCGWFANCYMAGCDFANGGGPINGDHAQWLIDRDQAETP